jgi:hypothetical protein
VMDGEGLFVNVGFQGVIAVGKGGQNALTKFSRISSLCRGRSISGFVKPQCPQGNGRHAHSFHYFSSCKQSLHDNTSKQFRDEPYMALLGKDEDSISHLSKKPNTSMLRHGDQLIKSKNPTPEGPALV